MKEKGASVFRNTFDKEPAVCSQAPGRVELLGNHTDYNDGFVMSVALDMNICMCAAPRDDDTAVVYSESFDSSCSFSLGNLTKENDWCDYIRGVADEMGRLGHAPGGFEAVILSTVPTGTGLSSSAALEVSAAVALKGMYPYEIKPFDLAKMCRAAENNFVGMNCGILDQFSSVFGRKNSAMFLDCRKEEHDVIPLGADDVSVVICNSMKKHALVSSQYNTRRQECINAADYFAGKFDGVTMLRDVTPDMFRQESSGLPENQRKRAEHIVYENERVLSGCSYLKDGEFEKFGQLMNESHRSSRDLFENSTPELDLIQKTAVSCEGVVGSKLSGGGFGGAVVALVRTPAVEAAVETLDRVYMTETGIKPQIFIAAVSDGASLL